MATARFLHALKTAGKYVFLIIITHHNKHDCHSTPVLTLSHTHNFDFFFLFFFHVHVKLINLII
jgi:hypothetical protein